MKIIFWIFVCIVLTSCAQPGLKPEDRSAIGRLDVLIFSDQVMPVVESAQPYNYSGGVIGAVMSEVAMAEQASKIEKDYRGVASGFLQGKFSYVLGEKVRDTLLEV